MKYLFDTHSFLWWANEPEHLSSTALGLCQDTSNILLLSLASVWEIQIKLQLGKLDLKLPLIDLITSQQQKNRIQLLPISLPHILTLDDLPHYHRDPFDRLLIAQAKVEQTPLITGDPEIAKYPVQVAW